MRISDWSSDVCSSDLLKHRAAGFLIGAANGVDGIAMRHAIGGEPDRIEHHLILPDHAADARDLGNAGQAFQFIAQKPVLQGAKLRKIMLSGDRKSTRLNSSH